MPVREALFIRHGQTGFNTERRLQGAMPVPINERGEQESRALAEYLRTRQIDALYASPRLRAKQTADIVAARLGVRAIEDERLAEIAFGIFEGHTFAEVERKFPQAYAKWETGYRAYRVPEGESRLDVQLRMQAAWDDIVKADGHERVAIITHSSALVILLAAMFTVLPQKRLLNTSITTLERCDEIWRIKAYAETPHL